LIRVKQCTNQKLGWGDLYNAPSSALRTVASGVAVRALLTQRLEIGRAKLLALVTAEAGPRWVSIVLSVEVKGP